MGVSQVYAPLVYNGNGSATSFPVTWEFFVEGDLLVTAIAADGTEAVRSISTHYDVVGGADGTGGTPASGGC